MNEVKKLEMRFAGESTLDKYDRIAEEIKDVDALLVTALDEICWILNLRGSDIEYNPVFFSYLMFDPKEKTCHLYIE